MGETRSVSNEYFVDPQACRSLRTASEARGGSFGGLGGIVTEKDVEKDMKHAVLDNLHGLSHRVEAAQLSYMLQLSCS